MYSLPSASQIREPLPRTMYGGSPPTDLNARTGESTPPGITREARACSSCDLVRGFISTMNILNKKMNHKGHEGTQSANETNFAKKIHCSLEKISGKKPI